MALHHARVLGALAHERWSLHVQASCASWCMVSQWSANTALMLTASILVMRGLSSMPPYRGCLDGQEHVLHLGTSNRCPDIELPPKINYLIVDYRIVGILAETPLP